MLTRRQVLTGAAATAGAVALPTTFTGPAAAHTMDHDGPFALGIASGDPLPGSVILWTRLVRPGRPLAARPVQVGWQIAHDERFRHVVRSGHTVARPELGHSVHVDARGLQPGREYFYPFRALRVRPEQPIPGPQPAGSSPLTGVDPAGRPSSSTAWMERCSYHPDRG
jgi:alkaline phosphatase D